MKQKLAFVDYIPAVTADDKSGFIDMDRQRPIIIGDTSPKQDDEKREDPEDHEDDLVSLDVPDIDEEYYRPVEEPTVVEETVVVSQTPEQPTATPSYTYPNMDRVRYGASHYAAERQPIIKPSAKITIDDGVTMSSDANLLAEVLLRHGISGRISSAHRPGAKTSSGKTSFHAIGQAIDVAIPIGMSREFFIAQFNNPELKKELSALGFNILDETNPDTMNKTGATGPHFHIGRDKVPSSKFGGTFRHSNPFK